MRERIGKGKALKKEVEALEKELHHMKKELHFLMEKHYTQYHSPLYGAWQIRGLDWFTGKQS